MSTRRFALPLSLLLACVLATPVFARVAPYVRTDFGGNELRMSDGDSFIMDTQTQLRAIGYPADFHKIGSAYGPNASAGVWLFPAFRIGVTYSYQKSVLKNQVHVPGQLFYEHDLDLRMREIGAEAALRLNKLHGLIIGGNVAQGRAQMIEGLSIEQPGNLFYSDATAERTKPTYGGYIGFDQTNSAGVVGSVRAGFQYRDMGHMPSKYTDSDGFTTVSGTSNTIWMDYSGFYLKVGVGFDLVR